MVDNHWKQFKHALFAGIKNIGHRYFQIERYDDEPAWRERVYCYELYHQLRCQLGDAFPYTLHGEIDKQGQRFIRQSLGEAPNPDFVVHVPSRMRNLAVIEVKSAAGLNADSAKRDLRKLQVFTEQVQYRHGLFLIFGRGGLPNLEMPNEKTSILWHKEVGQIPEIVHSAEEWCFEQ
jgi:hypothetical protein